MRDWKELLNSDSKKNEIVKNIISNLQNYSINDIKNLDLKKDIIKRLLKLKDLNLPSTYEIILSQKERIEKCITFSYKEDILGKVYLWDNSLNQIDLTGTNKIYEIDENQPFWINFDKNMLKMDTIMFIEGINPNLLKHCKFIKEMTLTEYSEICARHRNYLFEKS